MKTYFHELTIEFEEKSFPKKKEIHLLDIKEEGHFVVIITPYLFGNLRNRKKCNETKKIKKKHLYYIHT